MTETVSMKARMEIDRAAARHAKAKADLLATLASIAAVVFILGSILGIVGTFRLVEMLLVK